MAATGRRWVRFALCAACLLGALGPATAGAQLLDDIEIAADQGLAEIRIRFSVPVRYLKHFPVERGELIHLYLQLATLDGAEIHAREEYKKSPPTDLIPAFTVRYRDDKSCYAIRDPVCVVIQFDEPVSFKVRQGEDSRSINLYVPARHNEPASQIPGHAAPR